ncbi:MAG: HDOD domain-containing protein [Desulfobulbaceae bacterium]|nr:MAG: HDOD domain-containing protein [Desulfobulbaceae bacterium]
MTELSFIDEIERAVAADEVALPVFNPTALKIQQELVKTDPDNQLIERLVTGDQALASQILRMANSSFYKGLNEILTVKAAIVRLGMQEIGRIVLLAASKNQYRSADPEINQMLRNLWQHSAAAARASYWIARRCNYIDLQGQAFFAGLLHDVGKLFVMTVIEHLRVTRKINLTRQLILEAIDSLHSREGFALMEKWNMPAQYCTVCRDHHLATFNHKDQLLVIVRLADTACHKLGIGLTTDPDINLAATVEADILDLSEVALAELEIMLEDTYGLLD